MPNAPVDIIPRIAKALEKGPANISKLSKRADINRLTVSSYLQAMEKAGFVKHKKEGRETIYMLRENPNSHFDLPLTEEEQATFNTYYAHITQFCKECFDTEPTRTQAYKIIYDLNKDLDLHLPIGWYLHGPCAVQVYRGRENPAFDLPQKTLNIVKEKTETYCAMDPLTLQQHIYKKEQNELYLAKEHLLNHTDRDDMNTALMDLIKNVPQECVPVMTDFASTALLVGWEKTKLTWKKVWSYIGLVVFNESLTPVRPNIAEDLAEKIAWRKREAQLEIRDLVLTHTRAKQQG